MAGVKVGIYRAFRPEMEMATSGYHRIDVTDFVKVIAAAGSLSALPTSWIPFVLAIQELDLQGFLDGN